MTHTILYQPLKCRVIASWCGITKDMVSGTGFEIYVKTPKKPRKMSKIFSMP